MNGNLGTFRTTTVSGSRVKVYSTSEDVRVIFDADNVEACMWLTTRQVEELIVILRQVLDSTEVTTDKQIEEAVARVN